MSHASACRSTDMSWRVICKDEVKWVFMISVLLTRREAVQEEAIVAAQSAMSFLNAMSEYEQWVFMKSRQFEGGTLRAIDNCSIVELASNDNI